MHGRYTTINIAIYEHLTRGANFEVRFMIQKFFDALYITPIAPDILNILVIVALSILFLKTMLCSSETSERFA